MPSLLAHQRPGIHPYVDFHDHVAEAAGIWLGLMRRIGWNKQPVACFHFEGLTADDRLAPVLSRDYPILVVQILLVGDLAADDHLASTAGKNVEIINAGVLLGVIPNTVDLGQAEHGMVTMCAVEHEHAEITSLQMYRPTAESLRASAACLSCSFGCPRRELLVSGLDVVDVPIRGGR